MRSVDCERKKQLSRNLQGPRSVACERMKLLDKMKTCSGRWTYPQAGETAATPADNEKEVKLSKLTERDILRLPHLRIMKAYEGRRIYKLDLC